MWTLEFEIIGYSKSITVELADELIIGRKDTLRPAVVQVDLDGYEGLERGVSRQHAVLREQDGQLYLVDLNTANGTVLNDVRLIPNKPYPIKEGDKLVLGALRLNMRILKTPHAPPAPTSAETPTNLPSARLQTAPLPGHGEMVLIVEDHVEVADLFALMLQRQGYTTQISKDSTRAIHLLSGSLVPDAVILDYMLPGIDGLEVCRFIRRESRLDKVPVLMVSAAKDVNLARAAVKAGADEFLVKPVKINELGQVVARLIAKRKNPTNPLKNATADATKSLSESDAGGGATQNTPQPDTVAVIVSGYVDKPFTLRVTRPVTFGRAIANSNSQVHIDLSRYGANSSGVSRVHLQMQYEHGKFFIEDMGSMNGTRLNDEMLIPRKPYELHNGQKIKLGQLEMQVYFLVNEDGLP